jgi:hypothetical protein
MTDASQQVYDTITAYGDVVRGVFTGHVHDDIYSTLPAKDANGADVNIPQITLRGGFVSYSNIMKITVK